MLLPPSAQYWFGTDSYGRDLFARVVYGTRIDLLLGIGCVIVPFLFGSLLGLISGYYGGKLDTFIMRVLVAKQSEYVQSAKTMGYSDLLRADAH